MRALPRIFDVERQAGHLIGRRRDACPVALRELAGLQPVAFHAAELGDRAVGHLVAGHLLRQQQHRVATEGEVKADRPGRARLADAGPGRQAVQLARAKPPVEDAVERADAGGPGRRADALRHVAVAVERGAHQLGQLPRRVAHLLALHAGELAGDSVELLADRPRLAGNGQRLVGRRDGVALGAPLGHDLRVAAHVGRADHALGEAVEVGQPATVVGLLGRLQRVVHRQAVGRLVGHDLAGYGGPDGAVAGVPEAALLQHVGAAVEGPVVDQQRAQHALLGLLRPGRRDDRGHVVGLGQVLGWCGGVHAASCVFSMTCFMPLSVSRKSRSHCQLACSALRGVRPMRKSFASARPK